MEKKNLKQVIFESEILTKELVEIKKGFERYAEEGVSKGNAIEKEASIEIENCTGKINKNQEMIGFINNALKKGAGLAEQTIQAAEQDGFNEERSYIFDIVNVLKDVCIEFNDFIIETNKLHKEKGQLILEKAQLLIENLNLKYEIERNAMEKNSKEIADRVRELQLEIKKYQIDSGDAPHLTINRD